MCSCHRVSQCQLVYPSLDSRLQSPVSELHFAQFVCAHDWSTRGDALLHPVITQRTATCYSAPEELRVLFSTVVTGGDGVLHKVHDVDLPLPELIGGEIEDIVLCSSIIEVERVHLYAHSVH